MADLTVFSRKQIEENTLDRLRTAGGTRPDLRVVELDSRRIIVKDFKRSDALFRLIVGPILIRREFAAMRNLIGVKSVPQLIGKIARYALAMRHVPGTSLDKLERGKLTSEFYIKLREAVDQIHSRGVAHCDLRSRGNVMLGDDGQPHIVDFAACVFRGRGINPFIRWLFHEFVLADENAVLLIKRRLSPELLTDDERAELERPLSFERPAKFVGETVRRIARKLLTRRH
ncbi:MAG: hypothetical protein A2Z18_01530 [Armatimonadetes bacterium RBG_16_58_9]|nr:MAG: hypothetical protein A2Z18_01530 [Armatimonadetes bacterium RBG_16_58_9]